MADAVEEQYYNELIRLQIQERELNEFQTTANRLVKRPSRLKYFFLSGLAIIADLVDLLELTGIGIILVWFVNIIVTPILFMAGLGANSRIKVMNRFYGEVLGNIDGITRRVMFYSRTYTRALRFSRRVGFLRKPVRRIALSVAKARRLVIRNPAIKMGTALILDLIPLLELLPWQTIGVYLMYQDEKKTFQDTQAVIPEYLEAKTQELSVAAEVREFTSGELPEEAEGTEELPLAA